MADDLTLTYGGSITQDNLRRGTIWLSYQAISPTLATLKKGAAMKAVFVHGNNDIAVKRGTTDAHRHYAVRRKWRIWGRNLDPLNTDATISPYVIDNSALVIDSGDKPLGEWFDAPGMILVTRQATYERLLLEWIVGGLTSYGTLVEGLGGLTFFILVELTPTGYRLALSPSVDLSAAVIEETLGPGGGLGPLPAGQPYRTEADIAPSQWLARHLTWQDYAALNAQLPLGSP